MLGEQKFIVIGAAVAALAVLYLVKKNGAAAAAGVAVGSAAVEAVGGVIAGASQTVGDVFGLPRVNETECEKARREGRYWDASFVCPASTTISDAASNVVDAISDWWNN